MIHSFLFLPCKLFPNVDVYSPAPLMSNFFFKVGITYLLNDNYHFCFLCFRLACHMSGYRCFQIELTRGYDYMAFREDLKKLYTYAGVNGENTVFLFSDTQASKVCVNKRAL